jgi:phosphatidylserine/phosphatidylglycerophosphate/cardiolipin synthase-like enzyme
VTIDDAVAAVLQRLSDAQIEALAGAAEPLADPPAGFGHVVAGAAPATADAVRKLRAAWKAAPGLTGAGVALALRTGLAARRNPHACRTRPVWTGPGSVGEQRLTAAVLHELLTEARERILLVSYAAYTLPEMAADLEAAVARGCQVDVVFETEEDSAGTYTGPSHPFSHVSGVSRWFWPADQRDGHGVLHAKLLVVDGCRALVGSANLTHRALTANIEAGALIRDHALASDLERHVQALMDSRILVRSAAS